MRRNRTLHSVIKPIRSGRADDHKPAPPRSTGQGPTAEDRLAGPAADTSAEADDRTRRRVDKPMDTAVYNCGCGLVFEAPVGTSVSCPYCDASQAW